MEDVEKQRVEVVGAELLRSWFTSFAAKKKVKNGAQGEDYPERRVGPLC